MIAIIKKHQNTLELAFQYSDFIYLFDDGKLIKEINKNKNLKKFIADQKKCKIIDVKELDFSEKIEMYNSLKEDLYSISKK